MTNFESSPQLSGYKQEAIFHVLEDFRQMERLFPEGKVKNWQTDGESCRFQIDGVGELGLIISKKEPASLVQYTGHGKVPFNFHLRVHLQTTENGTQVLVTAEAKLNPMLKMMVNKPIQKFMDMLCQAIANTKV